ncbi:MAG TPA: septum formation initiator family protein [Roseiflexaceae bacterium]|nr:septum formation initiator family protein [Roseiflexaceae bacterium]
MPRRPRRTDTAPAASALPVLSRLGRPGVHLLTLLLLVLSLWSLIGFVGQVITSAQMERRKEELRAENAQLATEIATLAADVTEAESPAYAERILREQRGYARDGDTVVLPTFPEITPTPVRPTEQPAPTSVPEPNWRRWATALFPPGDNP